MRSLFATIVILFYVGSPALAVIIPTVPVGNPGNAPDQDYGDGQFGAVAYDYRIGTYEVTNNQYVEFLNAKDPTGANTLQLYDDGMTTDANGGIDFTAANPNGMKYSVKSSRGNNPVNWVTWYDASRFVNWLHNGQGNGDTETGAYTLLGGTPTPSNGTSITRNVGAKWFFPSENEWYKAAYHQPAAQGGDSDDYWLYPTRTNSTPYSDQPPGNDAPTQSNTANFVYDDGITNGYDDGFAVTGSPSFVATQNYLTDVGSYTESNSFYGTFDQGGNVFEWNEERFASRRGLRGGTWIHGAGAAVLAASYQGQGSAHVRDLDFGFRVATIPEPSTLALAAIGLVVLAAFGWRRRKR